MSKPLNSLLILIASLALAVGCDRTTGDGDQGEPGTRAGAQDDGQGQGTGGAAEGTGGGAEDDEADETGEAPTGTPEARGEYLVTVLLGCSNCHTPRDESGQPRADRFLAGSVCPADAQRCRNVPNLTHHETGLADVSDDELGDLIFNGRRPDGTGLRGMPSDSYHHLTETDQTAVIAYLRTVPGVDNAVPAPEPGPDGPPEPPTPVDISVVPSPPADYPQYESAMRGRYLVVNTGACLGCHTPEGEDGEHDMTRALAGGHPFDLARRGMSPPWPAEVVSANLTPDSTGIEGWTADDIARALIEGLEPDGGGICPPMPSGPHGAYAGLTPEDASDIAHYLLSLPPFANQEPECDPPAPDTPDTPDAADGTGSAP